MITQNEGENIRRSLESVKWADEIVVADSGSTDNTLDICQEFNCKIIHTKWLGFGKTKQVAVENCSNEWILVLDADEVVTRPLKLSIERILESPDYDGYRVKRNSFYLGKMIKHCGWDKDYTLRLFNKNKGKFNNKVVHESVQINSGKIGVIKDPMLHYTYPDINSHIQKMNRYSELGAIHKSSAGQSSSIAKACIRGIIKFIKMFILQLGFLDGKEGFVLSFNSAFGVYLKYLYVWEKKRSSDKSD